MQVWLVVYILGKVAVSIGPLPYGLDECASRKQEIVSEISDGFLKNPGKAVVDGKVLVRSDIEVACVEQDERPELDDFEVEETDG